MATRTKERALAPVDRIEQRHRVVTDLSDRVVEKYRKRVDRGARLLDETRAGWWRHIHLKSLDMAHGMFRRFSSGEWHCGCIGAQVAYHYLPDFAEETYVRLGWYDEAMRWLGLRTYSSRQEVAHGFLAGRTEDDERAYDLLDQLWANEVRRRRDG